MWGGRLDGVPSCCVSSQTVPQGITRIVDPTTGGSIWGESKSPQARPHQHPDIRVWCTKSSRCRGPNRTYASAHNLCQVLLPAIQIVTHRAGPGRGLSVIQSVELEVLNQGLPPTAVQQAQPTVKWLRSTSGSEPSTSSVEEALWIRCLRQRGRSSPSQSRTIQTQLSVLVHLPVLTIRGLCLDCCVVLLITPLRGSSPPTTGALQSL